MNKFARLAAIAAFLLTIYSGCGSSANTKTSGDEEHALEDETEVLAEDENEAEEPAELADEAAEEAPAEEDAVEEIVADEEIADETVIDVELPTEETSAEEEAAEPEAEPELDAEENGAEDPDCSYEIEYNYTCDMSVPATCPGGICLMSMCIGPNPDPNRYDDCGNDTCDYCERADICPRDCGTIPAMTGKKEYVNETTISVWVHGFYNKSADEMKTMVYGEDRGCGGLLQDISQLGISRPCSDNAQGKLAKNQFTKLEYYGGVPAEWLTQAQIDEIELYPYDGPTALRRYGLIVAKYIRWKLETTGATHVNVACHSMGCFITRYVIENNIENLAAENRFVRWFTTAGVLAGARLARLYNNETVREVAGGIGLQLSDFVIMNPDFVQDYNAVWDHKLWEGNNPYFAGMIIHNNTATDPAIKEALNIKLLDITGNTGDEPNDGIMYTLDEYFHDQLDYAALKTPSGKIVKATHTYVRVDHMTLPDTDSSMVLTAATLFGKRKVYITVKQLKLFKDMESDAPFDGQYGTAPAEIAMHVEARYNPYVKTKLGRDVLVSEDKISYRSPQTFVQYEGSDFNFDWPVFAAPVLDEMTELQLDLTVMEVDYYRRFGIMESLWDTNKEVVSFKGQIPLQDGFVESQNENAYIKIEIKVVEMY